MPFQKRMSSRKGGGRGTDSCSTWGDTKQTVGDGGGSPGTGDGRTVSRSSPQVSEEEERRQGREGELIQVKINSKRRKGSRTVHRPESQAPPPPSGAPPSHSPAAAQSHRGLRLQPHDKLVRLGIHKFLREFEEWDLLGADHQAEVLAF